MTQHTLDSFRCISRFLHKRQGLSFSQLLFLLELAMAERPLGFSELSKLLGMSTAAANGSVDRLTKDGLAERVSRPDDRRAQQIVITEKGRALAEAFAAEFEGAGSAVRPGGLSAPPGDAGSSALALRNAPPEGRKE